MPRARAPAGRQAGAFGRRAQPRAAIARALRQRCLRAAPPTQPSALPYRRRRTRPPRFQLPKNTAQDGPLVGTAQAGVKKGLDNGQLIKFFSH